MYATSLVIQTQPPATVTAGVVFSPPAVVRLQDAFGNLVTSDSSTVVTATRNAGTAALQGTTSVTAVNGLATFSNLCYNKAETITIDFGSGSLTGTTSGNAGRVMVSLMGDHPASCSPGGHPAQCYTNRPTVTSVTSSKGAFPAA